MSNPVSLKQLSDYKKWLHPVVIAIQIISAGFAVFAVVIVFSTPLYLHRLEASSIQSFATQWTAPPEIRSLSDYQKEVDAHSLFGKQKQETRQISASACDTFISGYSIVGIIQGGENEALIKSKKGKQTSTIKAGETIEGVKVTKINRNGIVISCSGQEKEISIEEL